MNAITKTGLDFIDISPQDYYWRFLRPNREIYQPSKDTIFENALKCAVFEPELFHHKYLKSPVAARRSALEKSEYAALESIANKTGQTIISASDYDLIRKMADAVFQHTSAKILCKTGELGMEVFYEQPDTGATLKFNSDYIIPHTCVISLHAVNDASMAEFLKLAREKRFDKKAIIQCEGMILNTMVFILVEKKEPYKIGIYTLDGRTLVFGKETVIRNCQTYVDCLQSNKWPGLPEIIQTASFPDWFLKS